ncbi:MAG TPA: DUF2723 domain-containing protein, partial [Planctomycetota bacterium]|nr:DUF2723 domain-containing protein [Planctomycetota bacterium]
MTRGAQPTAAAITFAATAIGYALWLCPSLYWLDSGELAAASFELGIAHAPGQPLAMLLGKLMCSVPLGSVPLRVGLGQVLCGAGAAAVLAALGARLAAELIEDPAVQRALGVACGLGYAGSYAAAFQAIRPEVYALSALLVLGAIAFAIRFVDEQRPGDLGWCGLCLGLGLANHHYLTVLGAGPPLLALLARRADAALRAGLRRAALGMLGGLVPYVYLPLRAAHDPVFDWGHPTSVAAFVWTVSARSFHKSVSLGHQLELAPLLGALLEQLTPVAPLVALAGLYLLVRRAARLAAMLLLMLAGPILARVLVPFDARNPDAFAYLSTAIAALALLCVPLVAALAAPLPGRARRLVATVACGLCGMASAWRAHGFSLARFDEVRPLYAGVLDAVPPETTVVPSYFQSTFTIDALRVLDGLRPDLSYLPRHRLDHPGAAPA